MYCHAGIFLVAELRKFGSAQPQRVSWNSGSAFWHACDGRPGSPTMVGCPFRGRSRRQPHTGRRRSPTELPHHILKAHLQNVVGRTGFVRGVYDIPKIAGVPTSLGFQRCWHTCNFGNGAHKYSFSGGWGGALLCFASVGCPYGLFHPFLNICSANIQPSSQPTNHPANLPTSQPTSQPTNQPTSQPTVGTL